MCGNRGFHNGIFAAWFTVKKDFRIGIQRRICHVIRRATAFSAGVSEHLSFEAQAIPGG